MPARPSAPLYTEQQFRADLATLGLSYSLDFEPGIPDAVFKIKAQSLHPDFTKGSAEPMARLNVARDRVKAWVEGGRQPFASTVPPSTPTGHGASSPPPRPSPRTPEEARRQAASSAEQAAAELRRRRQKQSPEELRREAAASFKQASESIRNKRKAPQSPEVNEPYTMPPPGKVRDWPPPPPRKPVNYFDDPEPKSEPEHKKTASRSFFADIPGPVWIIGIAMLAMAVILIAAQGNDSIIIFAVLALMARIFWRLYSWIIRDILKACPKCGKSGVLEKVSDKFSHDQWHSHESESGKGEDRHRVTRRDTKQFFDAHYRCGHCGHEFDRRYAKYYMNNPSFDDPLHLGIGIIRMIIGL